MSWKSLKALAVIPARGGSKGIPRKNMCRIGSRTLIGWVGDTVEELKWIDRAVISSDDKEMIAEGCRCGLDAPFVRPASLSGDTASAVATWQHAWLESEKFYNETYDLSIWLQPSTPLRRGADVERCVEAMISGDHRAAATVSQTPGHFAPEKLLRVNTHGIVEFLDERGPEITSRQMLPNYFHRNGICYAVMRDTLLSNTTIVEDDCAAVVIDGPVANIDEPFDLEIASFLFEKLSVRRDRD